MTIARIRPPMVNSRASMFAVSFNSLSVPEVTGPIEASLMFFSFSCWPHPAGPRSCARSTNW